MTEHRYRLLIADDDEAFRQIVCEVCAPFFDIVEARTGDEAITRVRRELPDIALCDLHMPGQDGLHVLEAYKGLDLRRPGILMSARWSLELRDQARLAGIDSLLDKPFTRRQLLRTVGTAIETAYHEPDFGSRLLSM
ncbi:MAG: response regulator [Planctomycetaceae bacterium]|nr:response regulator [Planctomycetaceae bacterium]